MESYFTTRPTDTIVISPLEDGTKQFVKYEYVSGYILKPNEGYGMGKETLKISGPPVEAEHFFNNTLQSIATNSRISKQYYISNLKFEVIAFTDLEFKNMIEQGKAVQLCDAKSPCGWYGCTEPNKHKLHWVIK